MIDFEKSEYGCFCPFEIEVSNDERNRKRSVNDSQPFETYENEHIEYLYLTVQK